jgi:hypothetical protein
LTKVHWIPLCAARLNGPPPVSCQALERKILSNPLISSSKNFTQFAHYFAESAILKISRKQKGPDPRIRALLFSILNEVLTPQLDRKRIKSEHIGAHIKSLLTFSEAIAYRRKCKFFEKFGNHLLIFK